MARPHNDDKQNSAVFFFFNFIFYDINTLFINNLLTIY